MFDKLDKETIRRHTEEIVALSLRVSKTNRIAKEKDLVTDKIYKEIWHLNYKLSKLLEVMQLEWVDNELLSKRKKR